MPKVSSLLLVLSACGLAALSRPSARAMEYACATTEPEKTGWPLTEDEKKYVLTPEHERRPGSEQHKHLPAMWPVTPSAGNWGGTSWLDTHAKLVETVKANKGPIDVLLVGDSITMQWGAAWTKHFPNLKTVNIGIGGDKTQNVLWRLDHGGVEGIEPKVIVLLIGNNNMFFAPETGVEAAAKGIKVCADNLLEKFPKARLILVKIFPAHAPGVQFYEDIRKTNAELDKLKLEDDPRIHVLDLWSEMVNADGTLKKGLFAADNIHLTQEGGYELYAGRLKPLMEKLLAGEVDFRSKYLALGLSRTTPAFSAFAVDSLGHGKLEQNPVLADGNALAGLELDGRTYKLGGKAVWQVECDEKTLTIRSDYAAGVEAPPLVLMFNQKANHATLLGLMKPGERKMSLPCVLHLPDMGSVRITCNTSDWKLDYDARRRAKPAYVRIAFPPASAAQQHVEYRLEVTAIYPKLPDIEKNPLYDGFRRDWLNIFQVNPRLQMLANNASSDPCTFTLFEYADLAAHTPPLADGLAANDLVRMTLDRYIAGAKGYGQPGYGPTAEGADVIGWPTPYTSLDSLPSLLISACSYVKSAGDLKWAAANYDKLAAWGREMFASDNTGDGLLKYPGSGNFGDRPKRERRPANWWDTINFGHEDAFSNALGYRAATMLADLAGQLKHTDDAKFFADRAAKLRAAYAATFLDPATGVLAGWKSADGQLHDYWFTFVQGAAITCGLLDDKTANGVMDRLLAKMKEVGYTRFEIGLPGNLVPIKRDDYIFEKHPPDRTGEPLLEDGSDGFQYYENGGATGCWAYYTVHALYQLGRVEDARKIFHPMLRGYAAGEFQGFDSNGRSRDWRDWKGGGHGYEGLLVDNYHALMAVLDDWSAKP